MPEHIDVARSNIHEPKGVEAAASGHVYVANGDAASGTWGPTPNTITNRIVIESIADLQAAASNYPDTYVADKFYQMPDYTELWIAASEIAPIQLDYGLRAGIDTVFNAGNPNIGTLEATWGTTHGSNLLNSVFQAVSVNLFINSIKVVGQGSGGVNRGIHTVSGGSGRLIVLDNFVVTDMETAAEIDVGPNGVFSMEGTSTLGNNEGWKFVEPSNSGTGTISFSQGLFSGNVGAGIDLTGLGVGTGAAGTLGFAANRLVGIIPSGGVFIEALADGDGIASGGIGEILNCRVGGAGDFFGGGITENDVKWAVHDNTGSENSITAGEIKSTGTATTALSIGVPAKINGTTVSTNSFIKRFDDNGGADNELRYIDERTIFGYLSAVVSGQASGGGSQLYTFCVIKDFGGTPLEISCVQDMELDTSKDSVIPLLGFAQIEEGDIFTVTVENTTGSNDFAMKSMKLDIIKAG